MEELLEITISEKEEVKNEMTKQLPALHTLFEWLFIDVYLAELSSKAWYDVIWLLLYNGMCIFKF